MLESSVLALVLLASTQLPHLFGVRNQTAWSLMDYADGLRFPHSCPDVFEPISVFGRICRFEAEDFVPSRTRTGLPVVHFIDTSKSGDYYMRRDFFTWSLAFTQVGFKTKVSEARYSSFAFIGRHIKKL